MRRALILLACGLAALAAVSAAGAADECRGLEVCVSVPGPWVAIPRVQARAPVYYQLRCPKRYVVAGIDSRISERGIDVVFLGRLGSPVAVGVTTGTEAVFAGTYTGSSPHATSFRPFIGCAPARGGGGRGSTGRGAPAQGLPPRPSTKRRVRDFGVRPGSTVTLVHTCARGERLVSASHAVAFRTELPPPSSVLESVHAATTVREARITLRVDALELPSGFRAEVQVHAVCARVAQR